MIGWRGRDQAGFQAHEGVRVYRESGHLRQQLIEGWLTGQKIAVERPPEMRGKLGRSQILVMGNNVVGTILNCQRLDCKGVEFVAPCLSEVPFREAMDSIESRRVPSQRMERWERRR